MYSIWPIFSIICSFCTYGNLLGNGQIIPFLAECIGIMAYSGAMANDLDRLDIVIL